MSIFIIIFIQVIILCSLILCFCSITMFSSFLILKFFYISISSPVVVPLIAVPDGCFLRKPPALGAPHNSAKASGHRHLRLWHGYSKDNAWQGRSGYDSLSLALVVKHFVVSNSAFSAFIQIGNKTFTIPVQIAAGTRTAPRYNRGITK